MPQPPRTHAAKSSRGSARAARVPQALAARQLAESLSRSMGVPARRIRRLVAQLPREAAASSGSPAHVSVPAGSSPRPPVRHLPRLLRQRDDGSVEAEDLEQLRRLELAAAARRDYNEAMLLRGTAEALRPRPALAREDYAPAGVDAQEAWFLRQGFVVVERVLGPEQLQRARAAWTGAQVHVQADWEARGRPEGYFDIPNLLELDDVFVDMVDSPALVPLMARVTGFQDALDPDNSASVGGATGGTRVSKVSGRVVPSGDAASYTWWHNDMAQPDDFACPAYRHFKLFVWLWDVPPGGGATTVVPGTHRLPGRPQTMLARVGLDDYPVCKRERERRTDVLAQELMPNCFEAALPAGCAIAFDSAIWHTTFANRSGHDRRGAHFTYRSSGAASRGGQPGLCSATLRRLETDASRRTPRDGRQAWCGAPPDSWAAGYRLRLVLS